MWKLSTIKTCYVEYTEKLSHAHEKTTFVKSRSRENKCLLCGHVKKIKSRS